MIKAIIAERYATALFQAVTPETWDATLTEIAAVKKILFDDSEAYKILELPFVPQKRRQEVLKRILEQCGCMHLVDSFMFVVLGHGRIDTFPFIVQEFEELIRQARGRKTARVRTAQPLSDEDRARIIGTLEHSTGKQLDYEIIHDPSLLCGISAEVGHVIYDGSIKHRLEKLLRELHNHA